MLKIVADHKIPFLAGALEPFARVVYLPGARISRQDLVDADALMVRTRTRCDAALLEGTSVKMIASATIGHDHIDKEYCTQKGIAWHNAPGCNAASVAQYMASALAMIAKETGMEPGSLTMGIIGAGNVGKKVIALCEALGIRTLVNDPPRQRAEGAGGFCGLGDLIENSDIVSLHVPLSRSGQDKTYHMVDEEFLEKMKPNSWLVNTSRGEVVKTTALKTSLQHNQIRGAILDVWENEPDIDLNLLSLAFLGTPHIAGSSADGKANGTAMSVQAISHFFGLGIDHWQPHNLPEGQLVVVTPDPNLKSEMELFIDLSLQAYPIAIDDINLRSNPNDFEKLREEYPIRREPHALGVNTSGLTPGYRDFVTRLGYKISEE